MKSTIPLFLLAGLVQAQPSLTIYNQNFAVVRQQVPLNLQAGETSVSFDGVTAMLEPDSVVLRDPSGALDFQILEQSYRNDPVSQGLLLHQFEGKEIPFLVTSPMKEPYEIKGEIIRSGYVKGRSQQTPIIKVDGQMRFGLPGQPLFPSLGNDSILRPTLSWDLDSSAGKGTAQLSYLTRGFQWKSDYNLVITEGAETATLNGWVTLTNNSGTRFDTAEVQLMAGDVHKVQEYASASMSLSDDPFAAKSSRAKKETVTQKALDSFHLYSIARPVTLRDRETKQVQFVETNRVKATKAYIYEPERNRRYYGSVNLRPSNPGEFSKDVSIYWNFENTEENGLGVPLPAGKIRLYQEESNQLEFLGENSIDHTPQKEEIEFYTGNAFDLVGERKVLDFKKGTKTLSETIEIKLRNRSKEAATIFAKEKLTRAREWEISKNEDSFEKLDSHTIRFKADLAPDEETVITYTVRYNW